MIEYDRKNPISPNKKPLKTINGVVGIGVKNKKMFVIISNIKNKK